MLRIGKIKENALKRSILREIKTDTKKCVCGPSVGEDASVVAVNGLNIAITSCSVTFPCENMGELLVNKAVNNLCAQGAEPVSINICVLLPETAEEKTLKLIIRDAQRAAENHNIQISGGHTEVLTTISSPIITGTALGKTRNEGPVKTAGVKPGNDIILTKWIGLEGTSIIVDKNRDELLKKFPSSFIETASLFGGHTCIRQEAEIASAYGISAMTDVSSGGIFGALWEMAEASGVGLDIDLMAIPVRQETIEICEVYGINPYQLISGGALLIACDNGSRLVEKLEEADIPAVVIGSANSSSDRLIHNDEETRYLDMPMTDEIFKIFR